MVFYMLIGKMVQYSSLDTNIDVMHMRYGYLISISFPEEFTVLLKDLWDRHAAKQCLEHRRR